MDMAISITEARVRLGELIDRVERGEQFVITRDGAPVAVLRTIKTVSDAQLVARIRAIGKRVEERNKNSGPWPPGDQSWRDVAHDRHRS